MATITNTATIQNNEGYAVSNTTTWTILSILPHITLTKEPNNLYVMPGDKETIKLTCHNTGPTTYSSFSIHDSIATKMKLIDGTVTINGNPATAAQYKHEGNALTVTPGLNLDAGGTMTITFQVEIPAS